MLSLSLFAMHILECASRRLLWLLNLNLKIKLRFLDTDKAWPYHLLKTVRASFFFEHSITNLAIISVVWARLTCWDGYIFKDISNVEN